MYRSFLFVGEHTRGLSFALFIQSLLMFQRLAANGGRTANERHVQAPPPLILSSAHTHTRTLQRRTGFPIRRRGILDLDKPRQESVTKGPLSARETLTVMEMIPSLCGVVARERFSGIIRKWRRTKT